jgi:hypothetical protein
MFRVFPESQSAPLVVTANTDSLPQKLPVLAGGPAENRTMFIAIVKLGAPCALPAGGDPRVILSAGGGPEVEAKLAPDSVLDSSGVFLADVQLKSLGAGVYQVQLLSIDPQHEATEWRLKFRNTEAADQSFVWVVADNDREMRQSWISLPQSLTFEALQGETVPQTVKAANRGTGTLRFTDPADLQLQQGFVVTKVPSPIPPNSCGDLEISFSGQQAAAVSRGTYTAHTDDPGPPGTPEHNSTVGLTGTTIARDTTVAVVGVDRRRSAAYRAAFVHGDFDAAMTAVFEFPLRFGSLTFAKDQTQPTDPAAIQGVSNSVLEQFPDPVITVVTYFSQVGDADPGSNAVRDGRRTAVQSATQTAQTTIRPVPTQTSIAVPKSAFDVARANGVTQQAVMVVELIPPPVLTGVDPSGGPPGRDFGIHGTDLVLAAGEQVRVFFSYQLDQFDRHDFTPGPIDECEVHTATPELVLAGIPDPFAGSSGGLHGDHVDISFSLVRADGAGFDVVDSEFFVAIALL